MPSSIDVPLNNGANHAADAPLAFRRERYWFLSFLMTPFKDIEPRAAEQPAPGQAGERRGR